MEFLKAVIRRFAGIAEKQEEKGLKKYEQTLDPMDTKWDWLLMAEEELVDGFKYLAAERERRNRILRDVRLHLQAVEHHNPNRFTHDHIRACFLLLDQLSKKG